jgi:signal transduction histidine kinase
VSARELRFLQTIAREIGPAICNAEFLGRLRSRVGAAERARIARDLHDGIIQSLIGLEMQVDVWRREAGVDPSAASKLGQIQNALRAEVLDLRDLIQRVKAVSIDPRRVLDHLASLVERFQRDSGITARFVSEIDDLTLSAGLRGSRPHRPGGAGEREKAQRRGQCARARQRHRRRVDVRDRR